MINWLVFLVFQVRETAAIALGYLSFDATALRVLLSACRANPSIVDKLLHRSTRINPNFVDAWQTAKISGLPSLRWVLISHGRTFIKDFSMARRETMFSCFAYDSKSLIQWCCWALLWAGYHCLWLWPRICWKFFWRNKKGRQLLQLVFQRCARAASSLISAYFRSPQKIIDGKNLNSLTVQTQSLTIIGQIPALRMFGTFKLSTIHLKHQLSSPIEMSNPRRLGQIVFLNKDGSVTHLQCVQPYNLKSTDD